MRIDHSAGRRVRVLLASILCPIAASADPPFRDVLIDVPLNLTELPNIISKVAVECELEIRNVTPTTPGHGNHMIRTGRAEVNVVNGSVSQTVQILVSVPSITRTISPQYPNATHYRCMLRAFLDEGLGWHDFVYVGGHTRHTAGALPEVTLVDPVDPSSGPPQHGSAPAVRGGTVQWPSMP